MDATGRYRAALDDLLAHHDVDAASRFVDVDDPVDRVHCLDTGAGSGDDTPIVCLHGAGTPGADWVPLLDAFPDRRVLVPERPGHGATPPTEYRGGGFARRNRSLLVDVLDALDVNAAAVLGNSFSGYHALGLATTTPERVERLVLAGAPAGIDARPPLATRLFGVPALNRAWYRLTLPDDVDDARTLYGRLNVTDPSALSTAFLDAYFASTRVPGRSRTLLSQFRSIVGLRGFDPSFLVRDDLPSIDVPTGIVWGADDYFGSQSLGRELSTEFPDAEFVGVDAAGHMPWLEPGPRGRDAIREFL